MSNAAANARTTGKTIPQGQLGIPERSTTSRRSQGSQPEATEPRLEIKVEWRRIPCSRDVPVRRETRRTVSHAPAGSRGPRGGS